MTSNIEQTQQPGKEAVTSQQTSPMEKEDFAAQEKHLEVACDKPTDQNLVYNDDEEEPEIHMRTWIALAALWMLNYVQVVALQGPPAVVRISFYSIYCVMGISWLMITRSQLSHIGADLDGVAAQTWVPNALSLVQAVLGPVISSASDTFQARKFLLVGSCIISFVGAAIAPGSNNIYRLIAAQTLIGVGFASVPLAYSVPSEILPRRWRPSTY